VAVLGVRINVGVTQQRVDAGSAPASWRGLITNRGTGAVYLGPTGVSTSSGYQLDPGASVSVNLSAADLGLYGISASGTQALHTLATN